MDMMEAAHTEDSDRSRFDEAAYLRMYPDIGEAIARGHETSAWEHYARHGRAEGRPNDFGVKFCPQPRPEMKCAASSAISQVRIIFI